MAPNKLTLRLDEDFLRLVAYRELARWIVRRAEAEPWSVDYETVRVARAALEHFGDTE